MTKGERIQLEMSRKTYERIPTPEMAAKVSELEKVLNEGLDIWSDELQYKRFQAVYRLNLSDRRLILVYSLLDGSIPRTATYFGVNRKTIQVNLDRIKLIIEENLKEYDD